MRTPRGSSLRTRWVATAVIALVAVQAFAAVVSGGWARDSSIAVAQDSIAREGAATVESILRHLEPAEQSIEVTTRLLSQELLDTSAAGLERYLFTQLAVMPQVTGAFIGYPDGSFVFVATQDDGYRSRRITTDGGRVVEERTYDETFTSTSITVAETDDFDPRIRPWYVEAADVDDLSWTDPYVFFSSGRPGVTASKAVRDEGEVNAVVGVDVELTGLASFLDDLSVADDGEAFVLSGASVVGAPSAYSSRTRVDQNGELQLLGAEELGLGRVEEDSSETVVTERTGGSLVHTRAFPTDQGLGWRLVIRAPEESFTRAVVDQQQVTLLATFTAAIVVVLALAVLWRVTQPIRELEVRAGTDPLTRLANRRAVADAGAVLRRSLDGREMLSVIVLDVDGLKQLNDTSGHEDGDRLIVTVAESLRAAANERDIAGRLGGDEFVIIQPVGSVGDAVESAQVLHRRLDETVRREFPDARVGVTAGLSVGDAHHDLQALINEADQALVIAKAQSKGTMRVAEGVVDATIGHSARHAPGRSDT